ncbi:MAG TPA: phosphoribosylformylglycinamidine synthase subunit PurQ [Candidatus Cloacimonetes bacterium]|nr:phosphoribosylformylglycinamidine synthase subunit PurQ [Candidatus Cloacimonadota bacterium]HEX37664.1 phosphoribosylformylglycinamidine synthase subunit PurQ [Candidatus Cloacimonadota bacterium]
MKYNIIIFPGSNCDYDAHYVTKHLMGEETEYVWHKDTSLKDPDCVIIPGGFSYGDYLRAGAIAKFSPIMKEVVAFANNGGLVIGICNGFQVLTETGLLPGALMLNKSLLFICKHQYVKVINVKTPFTVKIKQNAILDIPIAHNEGNYFIDDDGLKSLQDNDQIVFQYCDKDGFFNDESNPNGSLMNIAGIVNKNRNVLGMMPHPERSSDPIIGVTDGRQIFLSIKKFLKK